MLSIDLYLLSICRERRLYVHISVSTRRDSVAYVSVWGFCTKKRIRKMSTCHHVQNFWLNGSSCVVQKCWRPVADTKSPGKIQNIVWQFLQLHKDVVIVWKSHDTGGHESHRLCAARAAVTLSCDVRHPMSKEMRINKNKEEGGDGTFLPLKFVFVEDVDDPQWRGELKQRAVKDGGNRAAARTGTSTLWTHFKAKESVHPAAQEVYSVLK